MNIILHADLPLRGKQAGEIKKGQNDEPFKSLDKNLTAQVDRGYREFWARRGKKAPTVSSYFIEGCVPGHSFNSR